MHDPSRAIARPWRASALLAAAALTLSGCATPHISSFETESERQQAAFAATYDQKISWQSCDESYDLDDDLAAQLEEEGIPAELFRCATVTAPFDWNDSSNKNTIELAITHLAASKSSPLGTLLGNPGGPGESGLASTYSLAITSGFEAVRNSYSLLGFDPRGIGRSTPLECDDTPDADIATCLENNPLAQTIGTSQVARDMDLLRRLMADEHLNYLGYSYGTVLGATYSTLFPERVGRMVLDSAIGAEWAGLRSQYDQSRAGAAAITRLVARCGTELLAKACPNMNEEEFAAAIAERNASPLIASDGTELSGETLVGYLTSALYRDADAQADALSLATVALAGEQLAIDYIATEMSSGGAQVGPVGMVIECHSFAADADVTGLVAHIEKVGVPPLLGDPDDIDALANEFGDPSCATAALQSDEITGSFSGSPVNDILVIGITGDHATPFEGAKQLVRELGTATLLTLEGEGHIASYAERSTCIDDAVTEFLLDGKMPPKRTVCTDD